MTTLEIILIAVVWIAYGVFNSYQHKWFYNYLGLYLGVLFVIIFAPIALLIRIFRGVFIWKGLYIILLIPLLSFSQLKSYPIMCFKSKNNTYFYIITHNNMYYYNFSNKPVDNFKTLYWKKDNKIPIDTSSLEMIGNTKIDESEISDKLKKELNK